MVKKQAYKYIFTDLSSRGQVLIGSSMYALSLYIQDDSLLKRRRSVFPSHIADLIDIGISVNIADRLSSRRENYITDIHITLPLRNPDLFIRPSIYNLLTDALHFFSDDAWSFSFVRRESIGRISESQTRFEERIDENVEVALWSGGLDSLAGLYNRIKAKTNQEYTLFSVNNNKYMQGIKKRLIESVSEKMPDVSIKSEEISVFIKGGKAIKGCFKLSMNHSPRTRGFLFLLLGSAVAYLEKSYVLNVYENGIGAINLPYLSYSLRRDHSHAVNPISLLYVQRLISEVADVNMQIINPFLFYTKAQICSNIIFDGHKDLVNRTISCDSRRRDSYIQCGKCSSCLLRMQALAFNGVYEKRFTAKNTIRNSNDENHLKVMLYQVKRLKNLFSRENVWYNLTKEFIELENIEKFLLYSGQYQNIDIQSGLINLYSSYVREWDCPEVLPYISERYL